MDLGVAGSIPVARPICNPPANQKIFQRFVEGKWRDPSSYTNIKLVRKYTKALGLVPILSFEPALIQGSHGKDFVGRVVATTVIAQKFYFEVLGFSRLFKHIFLDRIL